ncbi:MAG TPA: cryptochrome/photolyase family protein [Microbacteriaceae bacterium]|nr:cryptochrome/photolyase family protein [Microbacteriaceae bacterium]
MSGRTVRWLTADQLGPHFDDGGPTLLIENAGLLARRPMHWAKAHLILSAIRHRAAEARADGEPLEFVRADSYREVLQERLDAGDRIEMVAGSSHGLRALASELDLDVLPSRGFVTSEADFDAWRAGRSLKGLKMDDFYRWWRSRSGVLMDGPSSPVGGQFSFDADNRQPPPKGASTLGLPDPWRPQEDDIDAGVRADLQRWSSEGRIRLLGRDGPRRFAVTRTEAQKALDDFIATRLGDFGPFEDAMLADDAVMAHSQLSVPLNLGVLDPNEVIDRVCREFEAGRAPLASVEGIIRQIAGWRDWVWHLYWQLGEDYIPRSNALGARSPLPAQWWQLDGSGVAAACLGDVLDKVGERGWAHHIERLMVLGNWALQRGFDPAELNDWFTNAFVDGTPWVMPANVVGMSQHADGGLVATKPYAAGGAYISKMSNYCGGCRFNPKVRVGAEACPFTAGYWAFLDRVEPRIRGNHRMAQTLGGLRQLADRDAVVAQERLRDPGTANLPSG